MAPWLHLAALPSSMILFILNSAPYASLVAAQNEWHHNLPRHEKYYPEDEIRLRRNMEIQNRMMQSPVGGVRKMSPDPGEKFYLDYWTFMDDLDPNPGRGIEQQVEDTAWENVTTWTSFDRPIRVHNGHDRPSLLRRMSGFHVFAKRQFQCPSGTSACTSINRPNSCCGTGSTCVIVEDTGLGDVGCCANGQTCAGSLADCESGYSSCPNNPGGGCCLPGYACYDIGCVQTNTATVSPPPGPSTTTVTSYTTITPSLSTTSTSSTTSTTSTSQTSVSTNTSTLPPVIVTVTRTVTVTSSPPATLTCASAFRTCPASLGGGCCHTDRECGDAECPEPTTTTATASPPVRPTSEVTTTETTTVPAPTSTIVDGCPTGFYACSAYYQGGCCQIGRDCGTTSCPAGGSTTVVDEGSVTIVAPTGSGITGVGTLLTGSCAQGWATCEPDVGGGCCPSGYTCETATCAAASGGAAVGKLAPESGAIAIDTTYLGWLGGILAIMSGFLGVIL
ncbi:hypothetical protein PV10_08008 [Exophiala mesophila]|uniref:GPI anchored protein n=1 Tax=Exophiala mesophila TaxID=212818 RepID=A0A0D1ZNE6_EXOME|nr:uncharacterized protein PV10_08008 [Exophiala mesophila]KIV88313.1 hypothetical protein PV10_08008 [Exophiala mesophila]